MLSHAECLKIVLEMSVNLLLNFQALPQPFGTRSRLLYDYCHADDFLDSYDDTFAGPGLNPKRIP